jgi:uncharacterized protein (DUF1684 family)
MMRFAHSLSLGLLCLLVLGGAGASPEQVWKAGIAEENRDYAQILHAMLKIQDSAYLGDGDSVVLRGRAGQAASWRWDHDPHAQGLLRVSLKAGILSVMKNGKPVAPGTITKSIVMDTDVDVAGQPTQVGAGVDGWRIFVYNQRNPAATNFTGVSYFPYDAAFRVAARFVPDVKLPARVFRTSRGTDKQFFHVGDALFVLKGKNIRLPLYSDNRDPKKITDISAFFTDALTGRGAYGAGRYVDAEAFGHYPPAKITIDFNEAYNPNCARSVHFTCPVAIDAIPLAVRAGERDPHMAH